MPNHPTITLKIANQDGVPSVPEAPVVLTQGFPRLKNFMRQNWSCEQFDKNYYPPWQLKWDNLYFSYGQFDENYDPAWILTMIIEECPTKLYNIIVKTTDIIVIYKYAYVIDLRWKTHNIQPPYEYEAEFSFQTVDYINLQGPQVLQHHCHF